MISLNNDGKESVVNWGAQVANTWKTNSKLNPTWESLTNAINNQRLTILTSAACAAILSTLRISFVDEPNVI